MHRHLEQRQRLRAPERDERAVDEGVACEEEGEEQEGGLGERDEGEGEEDEDLEDGGQSGGACQIRPFLPARGATYRDMWETPLQRIQYLFIAAVRIVTAEFWEVERVLQAP